MTRGDCEAGPRPCRRRRCRYYLRGRESCALDIADRGEHSLHIVARILGVSHVEVWRIEQEALAHMREALAVVGAGEA